MVPKISAVPLGPAGAPKWQTGNGGPRGLPPAYFQVWDGLTPLQHASRPDSQDFGTLGAPAQAAAVFRLPKQAELPGQLFKPPSARARHADRPER